MLIKGLYHAGIAKPLKHKILVRTPRITTKKRNRLLEAFCIYDMTASHAAKFAGLGDGKKDGKRTIKGRKTANRYYNHFREKIADYLRAAPRFSGEVEMDQSYFGKGVKREKYNQRVIGNRAAYGAPFDPRRPKKAVKDYKILVFGILQRGGKVYTQIIKDQSADTLVPIIHMVVEPKTTIYTDAWRAFDGLKLDDYKHKPVNHSLGAVGLDGAHTGNIEGFWGMAKTHLGHYRGISRRTFPLHLKECELRYNIKDPEELLKFMKKLVFPRKARSI